MPLRLQWLLFHEEGRTFATCLARLSLAPGCSPVSVRSNACAQPSGLPSGVASNNLRRSMCLQAPVLLAFARLWLKSS